MRALSFATVANESPCVIHRSFGTTEMSGCPRSVLDMTTATPPKWDRTLMCIKWGLSEITAEYHPQDRHGAMKYSLHVHGGRGNGVVIQCRTELSVVQLFNEVVALHKLGICHPYLYDV